MEADGVALVTGAGRGLGRALARALARRGFEVVGTVRSDADAEALRADAARDGLRLRPLVLDDEEWLRRTLASFSAPAPPPGAPRPR